MDNRLVVVVGGGAAGLVAAGRAAETGAHVLLLEKNKVLGRKLLLTGKGRCNVTNAGDIRDFITHYPRGNGKFLYSALNRFSNQNLRELLSFWGVELQVERGGRIFPRSGKASDIVSALSRYLDRGKAEIRLGESVLEVLADRTEIAAVRTTKDLIRTRKVIIASGGKSYPATGSTGDGYRWARQLGHTVTPLSPALVPLNIVEPWAGELKGLALKNVKATLFTGEKELGSEFGELLFTHFGVSGPIILTLSRLVVLRRPHEEKLKVVINLKPALSWDQLDKRLQRDFVKNQNKQLKNALGELLPSRLVLPVIRQSGVSPEKPVHQVTRGERIRLAETLTGLSLTVAGPRPMSEAIVTAGGVALDEVNPKTMESRLVKGLYFAGEVLDIDGYTGGYNLQAAFSTGYVAGESAALACLAGS